jgi:GT2 family glycosyltransferase
MKKCDVIIPVYKSPEWVKLCVYSLFKNTNNAVLNTVYLINDCDDKLTENCLKNLTKKYDKIKILKNEKNLGFIKTTNKGLRESKSDYVLLLNTDCIIAENTISKLISHVEKNNKIGLICPISSNAANLTLDMYDGFSFMQMDKLLERKFSGMCFDACTVVGNCLLITKDCLKKTGYLDEAYGTGYGEETDYQFKAMEKGFEAKVAIDTYVFHKSEVSFGTSVEKQARLKKNRDLFFSRWGNKYSELMKKYVNNDPIKYINSHISEEDKSIKFDFLLYLIGFSQNAGGVHMAVDMINYMTINNVDCNIFYNFMNEYNEILLFKPIQLDNLKKYKFNCIISTLYYTTFLCKKISDEYNVPLIYFAQGYEPYFENGADYGVAELSYKLSDKILTISSYLMKRYKDVFNVDSDVISNGINYDLLHFKNNSKKVKKITISLRNNVLKGDFILIDLIKIITNKFNDLEINVIYSNKELIFPFNDNKTIKINKFFGPLNRKEIASILQDSDVFIDTSLTEGFGLMSLEAMAAGNVVILSNSGGINEYVKDGKNAFVVNDVNNVDSYLNALNVLINDEKKYQSMKDECENTAKIFDYDTTIEKYKKFFSKKVNKLNYKLNTDEEKLYYCVLDKRFRTTKKNNPKGVLYKICKMVPKSVRIFIKKKIEKLYNFTNAR